VIAVVSRPGDPHAERVVAALAAAGQDPVIVDLSDLPGRASLTVDFDDCACGRPKLRWRTDAGEDRDLANARSAWWRRPQTPDLSSLTDRDVFAFTHGEWLEATHGLWQLMRVPWMNPPARDEVAGRKLLQLQLAREFGLAIPRTLVTSDPTEAERFLDRAPGARTIFKTFSCTHQVWRETRLVGPAERGALGAVQFAPVIFQDYVEAEADVRVTVVGDRIFAAAIHSATTDYPVDFRMSLGQAGVEPCELPRAVEGRLRALMGRLGLVYGAVDFRRTPAGDHVFLEVNTAGEWLFVEERTGQPITEAVAGWLADPVGSGRLSAPVAG
jgi:glutathione synthase/RimK-type ligase-like ATP-grasp enzyme